MNKDTPVDIQGRRVDQTLCDAAAALASLPQAAPRLEAELLLIEATGWARTRLVAWPEAHLEPVAAARFAALLARRLAGEPIAYIRGRQAFWTLDLKVTPDTLIPRPETELLVEIALELPDPDRPRRIADLGTGSGAIAAAVASERPAWQVIATDRSADALAVARSNFRDLGLANVRPLSADWLSPIASCSLDLILANPPYVAAADPHLDQGDLPHEPRAALTPGPDGLAAIRRIAAEAVRCLRPGGLLAVEHGFDQGAAVRGLFGDHGLRDPQTRHDLAGLDRVTLGQL
ncbi:peptide chain release factor N(5)-glutamine methyltransferase [Candidatus Thiodictyon syntrophicum]|jgi:release factor glutamine methyltransferase|uniref:Release factor glutamine methyltransferase n=1 Tax=Candidatus Thiodictyon syntrophicum TaxID=1166950 RepID=A0A2K8UFF5_9GAMM|nr:peptide chain release factor N(5)-glutamine methyltransferase [Candidatus Thiodictyon syntrophicum]AUB84292.1 protein-(glutamine-N5) methyltransferase, release factor-specific [Candidatus Thiodictyon syntrophicum]